MLGGNLQNPVPLLAEGAGVSVRSKEDGKPCAPPTAELCRVLRRWAAAVTLQMFHCTDFSALIPLIVLRPQTHGSLSTGKSPAAPVGEPLFNNAALRRSNLHGNGPPN